MMLSDVCLTSVAYIGPKSRTERPRKTQNGTQVAHVTFDSDTTFKVKRSKIKVTGPLYLPRRLHIRQLQRWTWESIHRGNLLLAYVAVCRRGRLGGARRLQTEERGGAAGHIVAAAQTVCLLRPAHRVVGIKRWCASDVCLSRISGLSREQGGMGRLQLAQFDCGDM